MTTTYPMCLDCKHLRPRIASGPMTCDAFPAGIPRAILFDGYDHCAPYPGDGGVTFEPDETAPIWRSRCVEGANPGPLGEREAR